MKKFACQYALLRFRPFIETGEFANVGLAMMAPDARFFGFRILKKYGRITQFFHQLDRQIYLDGRQLFREEMERFGKELRRSALDGRKTQPDLTLARNLFAEVVRPREAMLQFSEQRIVLAEDPKAKLVQLFEHYVERNFVTKEYQERLLENNVRKILASAQLGTKYQREKIGNDDFSVNFPFVSMVESKPDRIIKPLYLAQSDTNKILTHGGQWVDKVRRLRHRNALPPDVLFPVSEPAADTKPYHAFQEIRADLLAAGIQVVRADDERKVIRFASEAASWQ